MKTRDLLNALPEARIEGDLPETVTGLQYDSRQVTPGDVFICLEGLVADGHRYAGVAAGRGATVVVARRVPDPRPDVPLVLVPDTREALARLAAAFHGYPSRELKLAAVTGTNGKTTTTH